MWNKGYTLPLLMGVQAYTAILEINMAVSQKTEDWSTSGSSNTTPKYIPKGGSFLPEGQWLSHGHCYFIHNSPKLEKKKNLDVLQHNNGQRKCGICPNIRWSTGNPMEERKEGSEELEGSGTYHKNMPTNSTFWDSWGVRDQRGIWPRSSAYMWWVSTLVF